MAQGALDSEQGPARVVLKRVKKRVQVQQLSLLSIVLTNK